MASHSPFFVRILVKRDAQTVTDYVRAILKYANFLIDQGYQQFRYHGPMVALLLEHLPYIEPYHWLYNKYYNVMTLLDGMPNMRDHYQEGIWLATVPYFTFDLRYAELWKEQQEARVMMNAYQTPSHPDHEPTTSPEPSNIQSNLPSTEGSRSSPPEYHPMSDDEWFRHQANDEARDQDPSDFIY